MKVANPLTILPKFLNTLKSKEMYIMCQTDNHVMHNYWDQECLDIQRIVLV